MRLFKRGKFWWFEFQFDGVPYRKSTKSEFEDIALRKGNEFRRKLELGEYDLVEVRKTHKQSLFRKEVLAYVKLMQPHWKSKKTREMHNTSLGLPTKKYPHGFPKLLSFFGKMILNEITSKTIMEYQEYRSNQKTIKGTPPSSAAINREIALVRQLLDHHKLWLKLREGSKLKMMKENDDVGQALTDEQVKLLIAACRNANSKALFPAVVLSIFTGMRSFELRKLKWHQIDFIDALLHVGKSKTEAGKRTIDLNEYAMDMLKNWRGTFQNVQPDHYIFPRHQYGWRGKLIRVYPDQHYGSFTVAWQAVLKVAGFKCRWHDLRHTCASLLGEGGASEATMLELMGWMPGKMLKRYSHSRGMARKNAAATVGTWFENTIDQESQGEGVQ